MRIRLATLFLLVATSAFAQNPPPPTTKAKANPNQAQRAYIKAEQAYIFTKPDFDAEVTTILTAGRTLYFISRGKWGPFYKIRLAPGKTGYVLDTDVLIVKDSVNRAEEKAKRSAKSSKPRKKRSMLATQYMGFGLQYVNFSENSMGAVRTESLPFYGARWSGLSTFFKGSYTDISLLFHYGAPGYYAAATGNSADGWMMLADFLYQFTQVQSKSVLSFFGAGPMFRYSHINTTLTTGSIQSTYALDDMVLGAVFNLGLAARFSKYALRLDGKYYWEKQKYWALGLAFQFEF